MADSALLQINVEAAGLDTALRGVRDLSTAVDSAQSKLGVAFNPFKQSADAASESTRGFASTLKDALAFGSIFSLAETGIQAIGSALGGVKGSLIDFNSTLQQASIGFTTMLGSGQQAQSFLKELQQFANTTPFSFPELTTASERMLAFGFQASQVIPLLTAVGNTASAMGSGDEGINRLTLALGQMQAKGKVSGDELLQLQEAGINTGKIFDIIGEKSGKSGDAIAAMAAKGKLSSADFIAAFQIYTEQFGGMMEQQSHTFEGAMSTIKDSLQSAGASAFKPFFDLLTEGADKFATFLQTDKFASFVTALSDGATIAVAGLKTIGDSFAGMGDAIGAAFERFQSGGIVAIFAPLIEGAKTAVEGIVGSFASGAGGMAEAGGNFIMTFLNGMVETVSSAGSAVLDSVASFIGDFFIGHSPPPNGPLAGIADGGRTLMETYTGGMMDGLTSVSDVAREVSDTLSGVDQVMTLSQGRAGLVDAAGNLSALKSLGEGVSDELMHINQTSSDLNVLLAQEQLAADLVKDSYDKQLDPLEKKLDSMKLVVDYAAQERDLQLQLAELDLKRQRAALQPEADALDSQISGLEGQSKNIGNTQADRADATRIRGLERDASRIGDNLDALEKKQRDLEAAAKTIVFDPKPFESDITKLQKEKAAVGKDDVDYSVEITKVQRELADVVAGTTVEEKAAAAAKKASLTEQLRHLQDLDTAQKKSDADKKAALDEAIQARKDDEQAAKDAVEARKKAAQTEIDAVKDKITNQKLANDAAKRAIQDEIQGIRDAQTARHDKEADEKKGIADRIAGLKEQKAHLFDGIKAQEDSIKLQRDSISLDQQTAKLKNDIATAPIREEIDKIKQAEKDALEPLNDRIKGLQTEKTELGLIKQQYDAINQSIKDSIQPLAAADAAAKKKPAGPAVAARPTPLFATPPAKTAVDPKMDNITAELDKAFSAERQDAIKAKAIAFGENIFNGLVSYLKNNALSLVTGSIGSALGGAVLGPIGAIAGGLLGAAFGRGLQERLAKLGVDLPVIIKKITDGLGALVGYVATLFDTVKTDGFGAAIEKLWTDAQPHLATMLGAIGDVAGRIGEQLQKWADQFVGWIGPKIPAILTALAGVADAVVGWVTDHAGTVRDALLKWADEFVHWIGPSIPNMLGELAKLYLKVEAFVIETIAKIELQLAKWGIEFVKWIAPQIPGMLTELGKLAASAVDWIIKQLPTITDNLIKWGDEFIRWIAPRIPGLLLELGKLYVELVAWVVKQIPDIVAQLAKWAEEFVKWAPTVWPKLLIEVGHLIYDLQSWVIKQIPDLVANIAKWGAEFVAWVPTIWPRLGVEAEKLAVALTGWIAQKVEEIGIKIALWADSFVKWVAPQIPKLVTELGTLVTRLLSWVEEQVPEIANKLKDWAGKFLDWIKDDLLPKLPTELARIVTAIVDWAPKAASAIGTAIGAFVEPMLAPFKKVLGGISNFLGMVKGGINRVAHALGLGDVATFDTGVDTDITPRRTGGIVGAHEKLTLVGDDGPELLRLPAGTEVLTNHQRRSREQMVREASEDSAKLFGMLGNGASPSDMLGRGGIPDAVGAAVGGVKDLAGSALGAVRDVIKGGVDALINKVLTPIFEKGVDTIGGGGALRGLSGGIVGSLKEMVIEFVKELFEEVKKSLPPPEGATGLPGGTTTFDYTGDDPTVNAALSLRSGDGARWNGWCEKFVGDVADIVGAGRPRMATAADHLDHVSGLGVLQAGIGPPGSVQYWGRAFDPAGHVDINGPDQGQGISTGPWGVGVINQYGGSSGWAPIRYADGGWIDEPIAGVGLHSGRDYLMGENGRERIRNERQEAALGGGGVTVHGDIVVNVPSNVTDPAAFGRAAGNAFAQAARLKFGRAG